jgi:hypothetical protein
MFSWNLTNADAYFDLVLKEKHCSVTVALYISAVPNRDSARRIDVRSIVASSRACMSTRLQSYTPYVRREQPQTFVRTYALYAYKSWYTTVDNLTSMTTHAVTPYWQ